MRLTLFLCFLLISISVFAEGQGFQGLGSMLLSLFLALFLGMSAIIAVLLILAEGLGPKKLTAKIIWKKIGYSLILGALFTFLLVALFSISSCENKSEDVKEQPNTSKTYRVEFEGEVRLDKLKSELSSYDSVDLKDFHEKNSGKIVASSFNKSRAFEAEFPEVNETEYWELQNKITDNELHLKKIAKKSEAKEFNWVFVFSKEDLIRIDYRSQPSCGMRMLAFDSIGWHEQNEIVRLYIRSFQIGSDYKALTKAIYSKEIVSKEEVKLLKMK